MIGAVEKGISKQQAEDFWNLIIKFAGYGFNKSHSTAYALIAYMTAYLKAHIRWSLWRLCCAAILKLATSRPRIRWLSIWKIATGWG